MVGMDMTLLVPLSLLPPVSPPTAIRILPPLSTAGAVVWLIKLSRQIELHFSADTASTTTTTITSSYYYYIPAVYGGEKGDTNMTDGGFLSVSGLVSESPREMAQD